MNEVLTKLEELIGAVKAASIPMEYRWLDAEGVAAVLGFAPRYVLEKLANRPDFPKAMKIDGCGHPRWLAAEIHAWALIHRASKGSA